METSQETAQYRGHYIHRTFPAGYYEVYTGETFEIYDDLELAENAVDRNIEMGLLEDLDPIRNPKH